MLLLVPNGSVPVQWQSFLYQHCPALKLIVSSDSRPTSAVCKDMWVSSTAMRTAPDNLEEWPENLQYIWDKNDPLASTTVLLVPYTTFAVRSMRVRWHQSGKYEAGAVWSGKHQCHMRPEYRQRYKKRFSVVVCDEGHRLRHPKTLIHKAVKMLKAEINWVLSETYQINSADVSTPLTSNQDDCQANSQVGYSSILALLWPAADERMRALEEGKFQPDHFTHTFETNETRVLTDFNKDFLSKHDIKKEPWVIFKAVQSLPRDHALRLLPMCPWRVKSLIRCGNPAEVSRYFGHVTELVILKRTPPCLEAPCGCFPEQLVG